MYFLETTDKSKKPAGFIEKLIREKRINPEVLKYIEMEGLSYIYGFTPDEIRGMKVVDKHAYSTINNARNKGKKKGNIPDKRLRKFKV